MYLEDLKSAASRANKLSKLVFKTTDENKLDPCPVSVLNEVAGSEFVGGMI